VLDWRLMMKKYAFFAHFNRIAMQRGDKACWTVHFRGACLPAVEVDFKVPVSTRFRPEGTQPRATLRGMATSVVYNGERLVVA
jgi:hypothetical protein